MLAGAGRGGVAAGARSDLCAGCHREVTSAQLRPLPDDQAVLSLRDEMLLRTYAPQPLRACDDWAGWC